MTDQPQTDWKVLGLVLALVAAIPATALLSAYWVEIRATCFPWALSGPSESQREAYSAICSGIRVMDGHVNGGHTGAEYMQQFGVVSLMVLHRGQQMHARGWESSSAGDPDHCVAAFVYEADGIERRVLWRYERSTGQLTPDDDLSRSIKQAGDEWFARNATATPAPAAEPQRQHHHRRHHREE